MGTQFCEALLLLCRVWEEIINIGDPSKTLYIIGGPTVRRFNGDPNNLIGRKDGRRRGPC